MWITKRQLKRELKDVKTILSKLYRERGRMIREQVDTENELKKQIKSCRELLLLAKPNIVEDVSGNKYDAYSLKVDIDKRLFETQMDQYEKILGVEIQ
jgi:hypothetical protein